jgi:hypothetical protein
MTRITRLQCSVADGGGHDKIRRDAKLLFLADSRLVSDMGTERRGRPGRRRTGVSRADTGQLSRFVRFFPDVAGPDPSLPGPRGGIASSSAFVARPSQEPTDGLKL